ncbi:MAG: U32 family peptidase [Clostridia bacterium]|nr:U32 family peptidase [Clostridia bacterium]
MNNHTELLAPAGSMEALKAALRFGADAVYLGGPLLQLRAKSAGFSFDDIMEAAKLVHAKDKRLYVTVNALAKNDEIDLLPAYGNRLLDCGVDAAIVSDPGVLTTLHKSCPNLELHVSTQASCTNYASALTWYELGAKRIVLAREMTVDEIRKLKKNIPDDLELEAFVHGAMCMAYSGRCLLSSAILGRSGNRGDCAQPCRWKYALVEETRPNQSFPIVEEGNSSYILSSRDLNCIGLLEELIGAGVTSLKIEGRMKTEYYVAVVTNAYRRVLDGTMTVEDAQRELLTVSHRPYTTGFYHGELPQDHSNAGVYTQTHRFAGTVLSCENGYAVVQQRNRFVQGDALEVVSPTLTSAVLYANEITDEQGIPVEIANRVQQILRIRTDLPLAPGDLLRIKA